MQGVHYIIKFYIEENIRVNRICYIYDKNSGELGRTYMVARPDNGLECLFSIQNYVHWAETVIHT